VSSSVYRKLHGIHQKRTEALHFTGGVLLIYPHDHLDYHPYCRFEYRDVKNLIFRSFKTAFALKIDEIKRRRDVAKYGG
jgi:UDP-N-acetylmuramyl tripeptide synthase